ncbi:lysM domain-containing protein [Cinnamomum micranthum f. kanehirae]|uniref:LysM domain-containing protein n=1 Tax=Cinnamomum micranthum f. kanehirae TaxID=337451 RepID=A0A443PIJ7_9MAGN|nr:lysM domain-containing protein [Cinnamomum micranthum f. kanehirae]
MSLSPSPISLLLLISLLFTSFISATSASFKCTANHTCQSLIGYVPPNTTTISSIKRLFGLKTHHQLLGSNSWPLSVPNRTVQAGSVVRVPVPCKCTNGTGVSNRTPFYKVRKGQTLDGIATNIFAGFVTYQEIVAVNGIKNPNLIQIGQEIWIPLPCSCDDVEGARAVHYGHVVVAGSSVAQIAVEFGTTQQTLMSLNGIGDPKQLKAGTILDVPLKACKSSMDNTSLDSSLLVPNGTYALTANNCVECSCNSDDLQLRCKPAQKVRISNWKQCPLMQCSGNLTLGANMTATCSLTTCAYAGYNKDRILTVLSNQSTCPSKYTNPISFYCSVPVVFQSARA